MEERKKFKKSLLLSAAFIVFSFGVTSQMACAELFNRTHNEDHNVPVSPSAQNSTETHQNAVQLDALTLGHMRNISTHCSGNWGQMPCLRELSSLSMDLSVGYAQALSDGKKEAFMEALKQHCAASTAAQKITVPAYAMRSALGECVNAISDINDATSIKPDLKLYQLLTWSTLCLGLDPSCSVFEGQVSAVVLQNK